MSKGTYEYVVKDQEFPSGLIVSKMRRRKVSGIKADTFKYGPSFFRVKPLNVDLVETPDRFTYHEDPNTGIWYMSHGLLMSSTSVVLSHMKPGLMVCFVGACKDFTIPIRNKMDGNGFYKMETIPANTIMTVISSFSYEDVAGVTIKCLNVRFLASSHLNSIIEVEVLRS